MTTLPDLFPKPEPQPIPGFPTCLALARQRHAAREIRDLSRVTDCNILLRRHRQRDHPPA